MTNKGVSFFKHKLLPLNITVAIAILDTKVLFPIAMKVTIFYHDALAPNLGDFLQGLFTNFLPSEDFLATVRMWLLNKDRVTFDPSVLLKI